MLGLLVLLTMTARKEDQDDFAGSVIVYDSKLKNPE
jgi:hypothetical protein